MVDGQKPSASQLVHPAQLVRPAYIDTTRRPSRATQTQDHVWIYADLATARAAVAAEAERIKREKPPWR